MAMHSMEIGWNGITLGESSSEKPSTATRKVQKMLQVFDRHYCIRHPISDD